MQTFHSFKSGKQFEMFLKSGKYPQCHESGCLDYVKIGGILFTMHEYDSDGQYVNWANKKHSVMVQMETANRYGLGYGDAKVISFKADFLRNDIMYAQ